MTKNKDEFTFKLKGKKFGGRIEGWIPDTVVDEGERMWGIIFDSSVEKFIDGDIIKCSKTVAIHKKDDIPYILETKHSYYYLGNEGSNIDLETYYMKLYKGKDNWM